MRPGLVFPILAGLFGLLGAILPVPGSFAPAPPGHPSVSPSGSRCLRLSYAGTDDRWLPTTMQLTPKRARLFDRPGQSGYWATAEPGIGFAGWRNAGRDSIDIGWHHSPILRLPVQPAAMSDTLVGRGAPLSYLSLYSAMLGEGAFVVRAVDYKCPPR